MPDSNSIRVRKMPNGKQNNGNVNCDNNGFKKTLEPLKFRNNPDLPFFAYGIFKPGQLAYSRIEKYVDDDKTYGTEIHYKMLLRDGVPLIEDNECEDYITKGSLIYFKQGTGRDAYEIISNTQLKALYDWREIKVDGKKSNVLIGLSTERGIANDNEEIIHNFKGEEDPFFYQAIQLIEKNLEREKKEMHWSSFDDFFTLQMNYMLLWSAIERYASLKYDVSKDKKVEFAKDNFDIIKTVLRGCVNKKRRVYNSETLWCNELNPNDPIGAMFYYYTIRFNVVHKGKFLQSRDYDLLKTSLKELFEVFIAVLDDTFPERKVNEKFKRKSKK